MTDSSTTRPGTRSLWPGRPTNLREAIGLVLAATAIAAAFVLLSPAGHAEPSFLSGFAAAYPSAAGTPLDSCRLCHGNGNPSEDNLNRYGKDWEEDEYGDESFLSPALVNRDSDGDGIPNGVEIEQLSFPGDPNSSTPPAATTTTTTVPGTPPDGEALYGAECAACHGSGGGELSGTSLGRGAFISITLNGSGSMPAQPGLTEQQVSAIWDYLTGTTPAATTTTTTTTTLPGATTTTAAAPSGAAVYSDLCAACHGAGGGNLVPTSLGRDRLISIVTNGIGSMRGFPELGDRAIDAVAGYLLNLGNTSTTAATATTTVESGETPPAGIGAGTIYLQNCSACHGIHGEGGAGGPLAGSDDDASEISSTIRNGVPGMPGYAGTLSEDQISALTAHVLAMGSGAGEEDEGPEFEDDDAADAAAFVIPADPDSASHTARDADEPPASAAVAGEPLRASDSSIPGDRSPVGVALLAVGALAALAVFARSVLVIAKWPGGE